jgi:hypothetical protein
MKIKLKQLNYSQILFNILPPSHENTIQTFEGKAPQKRADHRNPTSPIHLNKV